MQHRITVRFALILCLFILWSLYPSPLPAEPADVGIVTGVVVDAVSEQPIAGATIRIVGTSRGAISTASGRFTVRDVEAGVRSVRVTAIGYDTVMMADVVVSTGKPVTLTIRMQSEALELEGAVVVAESFRKTDQTITSTSLLTSEEVRRAPGVQEDVVRAIALLPGVAVTAAGRNDLAVRGGAPFENLFLVDNIEVPNINHFGSQGSTGGPLSLINVDLVQDVALSTGGFGPKYGDRLSSVTNLTLRDGNRESLSGELNLSTTGFSVIGEGPIGSQGSFFIAARRSYLDLIFTLAGFGFVPEYWDLTAKVALDIDEANAVSFLMIGALDRVKLNNTEDNLYSNSRVAAPSQDQYFTGVTWRHLFTDGFVKTTLGRTYSAFQTIQQDSTGTPVFKADSREGENSLRVDAVLLPSPEIEVSGGAIGKYASTLDYDVVVPGYARLDSVGRPAPLAVDTSFSTLKFGLYGQVAWQFDARWRASIGGRLDVYNYLAVNTVASPRLGITYTLNETMQLSASGGRYYQAPQTIWLIGDPLNTANLRPLQADQGVLSFEWMPMMDLRVQVEAYYKVYDRYPVRLFRPTAVLAPSGFDDINNDIPFGLEPLSNEGTGTAMGVELLIQKKLSAEIPLYGLLSISVNRTRFQADEPTQRAGAFDTPFIGTLALGWRPDNEWELSGKVRTSQGLPTTPFITTSERAAETGFPIGSLDFAYYNQGDRLPLFFALDLRVDKRWFFTGWQLITYIDVQNVTGRGNVSGIRYNTQTMSVEQQTSIGVLPSIGINVEF